MFKDDGKIVENELPKVWDDAYISNTYIFEELIDNSENTFLVSNKFDKKKYVLKQLKHFDEKIYSVIQNEKIKGIPHIYEIYRSGSGDEKILVIIEEYIKAYSLTDYIKENEITEAFLVKMINSILDILEKLQNINPPIIHRDIKPDNILVKEDGEIYLVDFNISRNYTGTKSKDTVIMGTAGFAAPEQFGFGESDIRTDIYGLGATINHTLEKCNFSSAKLSVIAEKCMKLSPNERFQCIDEIKECLNKSVMNNGTDDVNKKGSYMLPGFRKKNPVHMLAATFVYSFLIYCTTTYKHDNYISDNKVFELNANRIGFSLGLFLVFLFSCNYLNWQNKIGWLEQASGIKKVVGIIIINLLIVLFVALIVSILIAVV